MLKYFTYIYVKTLIIIINIFIKCFIIFFLSI